MWIWVGGCGLAAWCAVAAAQTFYKWTDDRGVVHFADAPAPEARHVEERHLSAPPEAASHNEGSATTETAKGDEQAQQGQPTPGPAQVVIMSRETSRTGPSSMRVTGKLKNVGGAAAERVAVTIAAVDSTQGTPCLNEEVAVKPSTLQPGETGSFDIDLDSPCLFGEPHLDIAPVWG